MSSSGTTARARQISELSRIHVAQLAVYAAARIELPRPDRLRPRDRAQLAAAHAALDEIDSLLVRQLSQGDTSRRDA
ncbi:MAG: hypothetical protein H0T56_17450 [Pseudaminobacter sp.]|nr:hypothetical protein [Pseudaminobacter sp.]